ncbi:MAG TPA: long-chain fatty acid--CoA ligase [Gammaproteobacteria bacterium]|nr:long-chain fatty acid--CoA ligase [Gammaproteobacteria bacterium]
MRSTMMHYPLTLDHVLERAGRIFPEVEIVSRLPDKSLHRHTYADFYRRSRALAGALLDAGMQRGDRVATLMWNHYAHLEAYFGIPVAGGVMHTLNLRLSPADLDYICNHAGDRFLIVDDVLLPLYQQFRDRVEFERVLVVPLAGESLPEGTESYEDFLAGAPADFDYPDKGEDDPCGMCYTSGTTGRPKGVVYSHRSTVLHALGSALTDATALSYQDTALPVVPMFHANAWGMPYSATMIGARQVFPGPHLDAESLLDLYEQERVTLSAGVPTIWLGILEALDAEPGRWQLENMRMTVGGSAVPESMIRRFRAYGMEVYQGWGMTETSPLASVSKTRPEIAEMPEEEQLHYRAKAGVPVPLVDVRIMGDEGVAPWDGETMGELQVRGPWITGSYYGPGVGGDKFTPDGWLRTGDVATIDRYGYIKITDRTKDLIKSGGEWISSVDLENAIMGHPAVAEAAVIAIPHPKWDERPLAVVVKKSGAEVTPDELRDFLKDRFAKWMLPDDYAFVAEIPRTSTGKFSKLTLRKQYEQGDLKQGRQASTS